MSDDSVQNFRRLAGIKPLEEGVEVMSPDVLRVHWGEWKFAVAAVERLKNATPDTAAELQADLLKQLAAPMGWLLSLSGAGPLGQQVSKALTKLAADVQKSGQRPR